MTQRVRGTGHLFPKHTSCCDATRTEGKSRKQSCSLLDQNLLRGDAVQAKPDVSKPTLNMRARILKVQDSGWLESAVIMSTRRVDYASR